jgi:hypothetical protein
VSSTSWIVQGAFVARSKQGPSSQPSNWEPVRAETLSVTAVPSGKTDEQAGGQLIPLGELVTTPLPFPDGVIESVCPFEKIAVTVWLKEAVIVQVGVAP